MNRYRRRVVSNESRDVTGQWLPPELTRRQFGVTGSFALGSLAISGFVPWTTAKAESRSPSDSVSDSAGAVRPLHVPPRARRVIFLFMHGGPSHVDTFDYKPLLARDDGKPLPFALPPNIDAVPKLLNGPWNFSKRGESGLWVSDLLPHMAEQADSLCVIRSMHTKGQSHGQAVGMVNTGSDNLVRPSVGAWVSYALGSGHPDLPAHIAIGPATAHGGPRNYGAAFLPAMHQATAIGSNGRFGSGKIPYLDGASDPQNIRQRIDLVRQMNELHHHRSGPDREIEGAIEAMDLASRMREAAREVFDMNLESSATQAAYGIHEKATRSFGQSCLLARRLAEAGVRFITVSSGQVWDQHSNLVAGHNKNALATDLPIAALIKDLKQRGMWDDTLIVWGGEFGRTPVVQGANGRDHNPQGFSMVLAGGAVKPGFAYGKTDDYGYYSLHDRVHMHDLHATILHILGIDHERLTYRYAGRDFRLTDVHGRVVEEILA
ncbi:DUF1501 domain-containing protein [Aporhodopirellula aestuarii]|uniref:DUF1501 domain-containing protein n=1 Tax=Aporhodopirellula aestuarii TaxID=2950107 RepID=A0ABT0U8W9_9BACT|nr:DUF1501 domain-containing protein [Aporhodopirellula aestuarii]MCM2373357.1 DUF1501 domain-containing protein [Aporhodopirellula aestuarii]